MKAANAALKIDIHDQFCMERVPEPCGIVIFGASGDLAFRKLIPAIYQLYRTKLLPKNFFIVGFARTKWSDAEFRKRVLKVFRESKENDSRLESEFIKHLYYKSGNYADPKALARLSETLKRLDLQYKTNQNLLFYAALPSTIISGLIQAVGQTKLVRRFQKKGPWARFIIEKPFGYDLESAKKLDREIHEVLHENQIYRIDHYLGKETVQNILIFRFANSIFEPIWNRRYIDHIQITASETLGVEKRAGYYDQTGALRDMFQNHMFQLLALVAMEPPVSFSDREYRDEKAKLLAAVREMSKADIDRLSVRGQYTKGKIQGKTFPGYREEKGIQPNSEIETFVALKLFVDNWRWQGVPFYLRSGKRLNQYMTEIAIQFKEVPHSMFASLGIDQFPPNVLRLRIQPEEGICLSFEAKHPGPKFCLATLNLDFNYQEVFQEKTLRAYERLLLDAMLGDQTLFVREDMIEISWKLLEPVLKRWQEKKGAPLADYPAGSWGPKEAEGLLKRDGREWRNL